MPDIQSSEALGSLLARAAGTKLISSAVKKVSVWRDDGGWVINFVTNESSDETAELIEDIVADFESFLTEGLPGRLLVEEVGQEADKAKKNEYVVYGAA